MKSKKRCQVEHTAKRFQERFNMTYTQFIKDQLLNKIHTGKAVLHKKSTNRISLWDVELELKEKTLTVRVAYDRLRRNVASVLTTDMTCLEGELNV
jgi:hypothetical protein